MRAPIDLSLAAALLLASWSCGRADPSPAPSIPVVEAAAAPAPAVTFPELAARCAGPGGVEACAPGAFARTFQASLPWLEAHREALEAGWIAQLGDEPSAAYALAWLGSKRALPPLRERLLADRHVDGWEAHRPGELDAPLRDEQRPHHLAYILAIEHLSGQDLADAVALGPEERDRLVAEAKQEPPTAAADVARWLLGRTLRPAAPVLAREDTFTRYFFADGCWEARAETRAKALRACEARQKAGDAWERRRCRCSPRDIIEVSVDDPVVYYHYPEFGSSCFAQGPTPLAAWRSCRLSQLLERSNDRCGCPEEGPTAVRGPYRRERKVSEFDAPDAYNYLDTTTGYWLDLAGDPPCFVAGTPVATPAGPRAIESLRPGDLVLAHDPESGAGATATIVAIKATTAHQLVRLTLTNGAEITTTPNHPFYAASARAWVDAGDLRAGDTVLTRDDDGVTAVSVRAATTQTEDAPVHSISVTAPHSYFATGALVHNY